MSTKDKKRKRKLVSSETKIYAFIGLDRWQSINKIALDLGIK